ncbi:cell division protein ZapA [Chitinophaga alhagiae]|uniref:Cell division protein ZapA n=2 Tax=Chitinophaga TaxID=79328 RepID=A0A3N4PW55_9BACT|nr:MULTISPECIES: cell division protein ZapA [Chitinophaga]AWO00933.1 cell division protein ZapA [Chitinophaga alhagiae]RPE12892.1 cell division protein ZapA [Chitinophaga lutea]
METLIPVNIVVADRTYRIKIRTEEEEDVRRVMKEVNEKIIEFKAAYAGKDIQDYIAMALIMYATHPATSGGKAQAGVAPFLLEKLQHLDNLLDEHLK